MLVRTVAENTVETTISPASGEWFADRERADAKD
jgi:hypothetical protein